MPLVSSIKDQSKLPESLLVGGQCLDRLIFCVKPFDFSGLVLSWVRAFEFTRGLKGKN